MNFIVSDMSGYKQKNNIYDNFKQFNQVFLFYIILFL